MSPHNAPALAAAFLKAPVAHRALHDRDDGRPENSREAIEAAIAAGYGIEIDLQPSSDGVAMVFHDYTLDRVTAEHGAVQDRSAAELAGITLTGGQSGIPSFIDVLKLVAGRVPLLVEIKDQDRQPGHVDGLLERAAADAVKGYEGPIAFMSFNPESMARMAEFAPDVPRGLTSCSYADEYFDFLSDAVRTHLADVADFDRVGASFISHQHDDLERPAVKALRERGLPVLCWTIRSPEAEAAARLHADNVTFEGYPSVIPA